MDLMSDLLIGLQTALQPSNLLYCFVGALLGTLIGVLPGIGPTATIALLLPMTFNLPPEAALIMLAGIYYGAQYGGSTTAILLNLPGEISSAVTAIDGYQMARRGRPGAALAIAAIGSFFAGCVATVFIALLAPPLTQIALSFGAPEYFALIVLGLIGAVALAHGSVVKALAMVVVGLILGIVGTDIQTGARRFTFGFVELADGISFVALAVGVFGVAEILRNLEENAGEQRSAVKVGRVVPSRADLMASIGPIIRGTGFGTFLGVLPGGGAILSSFAAYSFEKKISKTPERFGYGAIEGVAAPESANNAGAQTSFIPMLTLGIPSNPVMALMVGALIIQGIVPGPTVITDKPTLFWGLIASMWIGNLMLLFLNLPLIGLWVKILKIPYSALFPIIIMFSAVGIYSINWNVFDLYALSLFGLLGYLLMKLDCEPAPLLLGFVLGPMLEEHFLRAMLMSRGSVDIFFTRPISAVLLALSLLALIAVSLPAVWKRRSAVFIKE